MPVGKLKPAGIEASEVQLYQQLSRKRLPADVMPVGKLKPAGIEVSEVPNQQ
jgi:hypothetical protein